MDFDQYLNTVYFDALFAELAAKLQDIGGLSSYGLSLSMAHVTTGLTYPLNERTLEERRIQRCSTWVPTLLPTPCGPTCP
jgi:hypothetical protein